MECDVSAHQNHGATLPSYVYALAASFSHNTARRRVRSQTFAGGDHASRQYASRTESAIVPSHLQTCSLVVHRVSLVVFCIVNPGGRFALRTLRVVTIVNHGESSCVWLCDIYRFRTRFRYAYGIDHLMEYARCLTQWTCHGYRVERRPSFGRFSFRYPLSSAISGNGGKTSTVVWALHCSHMNGISRRAVYDPEQDEYSMPSFHICDTVDGFHHPVCYTYVGSLRQ